MKVLLYSFITLICQKRIHTLEVFDVKVSKDILTEEAWGFIVTINSQTLYDHNYRYKMDVDGNNVGDSPCDKVSEGVVQFQCIYTGPVSNIQIMFLT